MDLKDGYLTISAAKGLDKDEKDKKGKYIRQERYAGACSRSFYVGDVEPEDVSAKYEDGILKLSMPKQAKKELPKSSSICHRLMKKRFRCGGSAFFMPLLRLPPGGAMEAEKKGPDPLWIRSFFKRKRRPREIGVKERRGG